MAHVENLVIEKGRNFKIVFTFYEDSSKAKPVDLTGMSFKSECRSGDDYKDPLLFSFICSVEGSPIDGKVSLSVLASTTKELADSQGYYDILAIEPGKTFAKGKIDFIPTTTEFK